jgi:PBP1b-binding outer membrane lipoprotein LpoB
LLSSLRRAVLALILAFVLTGCGSGPSSRASQPNTRVASASPPPALADLSAINDLGSMFNAHKDATQLILLLSPG